MPIPTLPLKIWTNFTPAPDLLSELQSALAPHKLIVSKDAADPLLSDADIALGQPKPDPIIASPRIKWIHVTSAGYTNYDTPAFRDAIKQRNGLFTNSSSVYDKPCAEHVFAMILSLARRLPDAFDNQRNTRAWTQKTIRAGSVLLDGQSALLYGYGAIAQHLSKLLAPFDMKLTGVRRHPRGNEPIPVVTPEVADALLPTADHIINILPDSSDSKQFFTAARLAKLKPTARFYNIGRGTTVDQDALIAALTARQIDAAYLDVMTPEPLAPDSPLWTTPHCYVTPHAAGGHTTEQPRHIAHFLQNLQRYLSNQPLADRVF